MNPEIVPIHRKESLREDGMLFVRTEGILDTMVKIPLLVASMIIVAAVMPIQSSFSSPRISRSNYLSRWNYSCFCRN